MKFKNIWWSFQSQSAESGITYLLQPYKFPKKYREPQFYFVFGISQQCVYNPENACRPDELVTVLRSQSKLPLKNGTIKFDIPENY